MTARRGPDLFRWLWSADDRSARVGRVVLLPLAGLYRSVMLLRALTYAWGWRRVHRLPLPTVAVGNLTVGGAGKTPVAAWIAAWFVRNGRRPGILLRGYGGDEPLVHQRLVPGAVVVADPDRGAGAERARAAGAEVLVLDDAFQLTRVARDLNLALVSVEHLRLAPWPLPAGPWREGWGALARADAIVVTRKRATPEAAATLADRLRARWPGRPVAVAHLGIAGFEGMQSAQSAERGAIAGKRVVAAAGIADPESFAVQVRDTRASVQLVAYQDHHPYDDADVARLVRAAAAADYLVVTEKDAVKLRPRWPAHVREPLVAVLGVRWEQEGAAIERLLAGLLPNALRRTTDTSTTTI